ncbi:MAG TPA: peptidoglycan editing factor PgeF [Burkholderiaceae bacterium]|nr:peptidoglycan editing factor PgeF [Burkholderiaceae bacterium]
MTAPPLPGLVPDWPASPRVRAFSTVRAGGVSAGPWGLEGGLAGGLNLGAHVGDDPSAVAENRARLQAALPAPIRWLEQVHGTAVHDADRPAHEVPVADAAVCSSGAVVLAVMTADCLPVLLADREGRAVALAHAGWRGLAAGVVEAAVAALRAKAGERASIAAWLGPAIGPRAFEVGDEVRAAFCDGDARAARAFAADPVAGKWRADLCALARLRLADCGVEAVHGGDACTVSEPSRFYSHRRDRRTGRMASLVWLVD